MMPKATSVFQQAKLKNASTASLPHWPRGTASDCPPAFNARNRAADPSPRQRVRKVQGGTPESATFIAVQLKPQTSVSATSSHHSRGGRWSGSALNW